MGEKKEMNKEGKWAMLERQGGREGGEVRKQL